MVWKFTNRWSIKNVRISQLVKKLKQIISNYYKKQLNHIKPQKYQT